VLAACLQIGCAARRPLTRPPETPVPTLETAADAVELLLGRYGDATSLKTSGKIRTRLPGEEAMRQASFSLMLERPGRLRMRVYRPLAPALFDLVSDGEQCWLYIPSSRTAFLNEGCGPIHIEDNYIAVPADTIAAAAFVVADPALLPSLPAHVYSDEGFVRLSVIEETGARKEFRIDATSGLVTRQLLVEPDGVAQAEIIYKKHAFVENMAIPVTMEIFLPQTGTLVSLYVEKIRVDPEIPADAFKFSPPANITIRRP